MKKLFSVITMVLLSGPGMMAQSTFEVNGTVVDKATGETVIGAPSN